LAATALPRFYDLSTEAEIAGAQGVAGGIASAGAMNFCVRSLSGGSGVQITAGADCKTLGAIMQEGTFPTGYDIGGFAPACTVTRGAASGVPANVPVIN